MVRTTIQVYRWSRTNQVTDLYKGPYSRHYRLVITCMYLFQQQQQQSIIQSNWHCCIAELFHSPGVEVLHHVHVDSDEPIKNRYVTSALSNTSLDVSSVHSPSLSTNTVCQSVTSSLTRQRNSKLNYIDMCEFNDIYETFIHHKW